MQPNKCVCQRDPFTAVPLKHALSISGCTYLTDSVSQLTDDEVQRVHAAYDQCTDKSKVCDLTTAADLESFKCMHKYCEVVSIRETIHPVRLLTPPQHQAFGMR